MYTIKRVATLLNYVSTSIIQGDLPKNTKIDDIGNALSLLYEILDEAYSTLYDAAN